MKNKLIFLILISVFSFNLEDFYANNNKPESLQSNAKIIKKENDPYIDLRFETASNISADRFFELYRSEFNWENENTVKSFRENKDELGFTHHRFKQYYKGIEVADVQFLIHEIEGRVQHAHGDLIHDIDINVNPRLSQEEALQFALNRIDARNYMWENHKNEAFIKRHEADPKASFYPKGELKISARNLKFKKGNFRLVYRFDIFASDPMERYNVDVDANTGEIINVISTIMSNDVQGQGTSQYNGTVNITVTDTVINYNTPSRWHTDTWNAFDGESWWAADDTIGNAGGYDNFWYEVLDTDPILLDGDNPQLDFQHRYNVEVPGGEPEGFDGWDGMNVRISTNSGDTWEVLENPVPQYTSTSLYGFGFIHFEGEGIPGWTGVSDSWSAVTVDLAAYAGETVQIRFAFASDPGFSTLDAPDMYGWQIDNISVSSSSGLLYSNNGEETGVTTENIGDREVDLLDGNYRLREHQRGGGIFTYDAMNGEFFNMSVDFVDEDTIFEGNNAKAGVSTHWGAEASYDYFKDYHGMNSFDNNGHRIVSYVHWADGWFNAQWLGFALRFGDGDGNTSPLVNIDIVAHEYAHAVTQYSSNLIYQGEYGALNESFSDVFGNSVEFTTDGAVADWGMGEGATKIRDMADPKSFGNPDTYEGEYWIDPENLDFDFGGVHINSGVQNYWYYLLCEGGSGSNDNGTEYSISPIGMQDAAKIAFRNLQVYLMPTSEYDNARLGSIYAAEDLFGKDSDQYQAVIDAWSAVGVNLPYFEATVALDSDTVHFFAEADNAQDTSDVYIYNYGMESLTINTVDIEGDNFNIETMPQLPATLEYKEFITVPVVFTPEEKGFVSGNIEIHSNDLNNPVKELYLKGEGWTITAASEGLIYAVISNASDGRLVNLDQDAGTGSEIGPIEFGKIRGAALRPSKNEIYATVFSSPGTPVLRIDASSGFAIQAGELELSNIRAIAFDNNDDLYGANYSNGDIYLISPETWEMTLIGNAGITLIASLAIHPVTGDLWAAAANTKVYTIDKNTAESTLIGDAGFPKMIDIAFDSEGKLFGLSNFARNIVSDLILIDTETGVGKLQGPTNMKAVTGMVINGNIVVGVEDDIASIVPGQYNLHQNYPNPFNPSTNIKFDIPESSVVTLKIYNLLGQEVRTLVDGYQDAGFKSVSWDGRDNSGKQVSSGVYLYSLNSSDYFQSMKMILIR